MDVSSQPQNKSGLPPHRTHSFRGAQLTALSQRLCLSSPGATLRRDRGRGDREKQISKISGGLLGMTPERAGGHTSSPVFLNCRSLALLTGFSTWGSVSSFNHDLDLATRKENPGHTLRSACFSSCWEKLYVSCVFYGLGNGPAWASGDTKAIATKERLLSKKRKPRGGGRVRDVWSQRACAPTGGTLEQGHRAAVGHHRRQTSPLFRFIPRCLQTQRGPQTWI